MRPVPVILDVDPGRDDAVAIMLACGAPELDVRAVTTVTGNVPLEKTTANALKVLSLVGRGDVPVGAGAEGPLQRPLVAVADVHGEDGLAGTELPEPAFGPDRRGAVRLVADVLREAAEPVTLIPLAPLTNVATFLREHPGLKDRVSRIVLMGGSMGPGNTTPHAEFNIHADPEAAGGVRERPPHHDGRPRRHPRGRRRAGGGGKAGLPGPDGGGRRAARDGCFAGREPFRAPRPAHPRRGRRSIHDRAGDATDAPDAGRRGT